MNSEAQDSSENAYLLPKNSLKISEKGGGRFAKKIVNLAATSKRQVPGPAGRRVGFGDVRWLCGVQSSTAGLLVQARERERVRQKGERNEGKREGCPF